MAAPYYIIRGGINGRDRLRILSRVMQPTTLDLLRRAGIQPRMACLEVGFGSGDLAFDIARIVGPQGRVLAIDVDEVKLDLARRDPQFREFDNLEFRLADITRDNFEPEFDLVHARFVLAHLPDPAAALARVFQALRPGGVVVVEDVDFRGHFCEPDNAAFWRYVELYTRAAQQRGGDPHIGPRLPTMLATTGFENIQIHVVQPCGMGAEIKLLAPITLENIADAVISGGLASREELDGLTAELYEFSSAPGSIASLPRIIEAWGCRGQALR